MAAEKKSTNLMNVFICLILTFLVAIIGFSMYLTITTTSNLSSEISNLRDEVKETAKAQLTPQQFQSAVAESLEALAEKKQQKNLEAKLAQYPLASEDVPEGKNIYGNINARFTMVEFSDLECPFCKRFHDTPKKIVEASKGMVNWQWKHLPLDFHNPAAKRQSIAAECVREQKGNKAFWVFLDDVFNKSRGNGQGVEDLASLVAGVGANVTEAQKCISNGSYNDKIAEDIKQATNNGINGTPATFIVDNSTGRTQLLGGAQPPQAIMAVIKRMIAEQEEQDATEASE